MKAQELRIGNWIKHDELFHEISSTNNWNSFITVMFRCEVSLSDIEPIPLTEEWLIKFDISLKYKGCYEPFTDVYWLVEPNGTLIESGEGIEYAIPLPKYVHQYQNLYFALTGEELEFKQ